MNRKEFIQTSSFGIAAFFFLGSGTLFGKAQNPLEDPRENQSQNPTEIIDKKWSSSVLVMVDRLQP